MTPVQKWQIKAGEAQDRADAALDEALKFRTAICNAIHILNNPGQTPEAKIREADVLLCKATTA